MQTDSANTYAVHSEDLDTIEYIANLAKKRTIERLNPKKIKTCKAPVIFDKRVSKSLLGYFNSAINGQSIAKKSSFLLNKLNEPIFNSCINIVDDPHLHRGFGSCAVDAEGIETYKKQMVTDGVLNEYFLDLSTAHELKLKSNASAGGSLSIMPSHSNLYIQNGTDSLESMIKNIKTGFLVTQITGMGVNTITGDYSQGASGLWIENGKIVFPIAELTIASTLLDMYKTMVPANDLEMKSSICSPSLFIENMTIAGK